MPLYHIKELKARGAATFCWEYVVTGLLEPQWPARGPTVPSWMPMWVSVQYFLESITKHRRFCPQLWMAAPVSGSTRLAGGPCVGIQASVGSPEGGRQAAPGFSQACPTARLARVKTRPPIRQPASDHPAPFDLASMSLPWRASSMIFRLSARASTVYLPASTSPDSFSRYAARSGVPELSDRRQPARSDKLTWSSPAAPAGPEGAPAGPCRFIASLSGVRPGCKGEIPVGSWLSVLILS